MRLGGEVVGEDAGEQVVVDLPHARDLRGERGGRPGVHHVRVADEAARLAALSLVVALRRLRGGVDRELGLGRHQRVVVVGLALVVHRIPDREGDAEEALARDEPVAVEAADPVVVAVLHVGRDPGDLLAAVEHLLAQRGVVPSVGDVPLPGGDDLERLVALLVEVRHPLRRLGLAVEVARLAEEGDHRLAGAEGGLARHLGVRRRRFLGVQPLGGLAQHPTVPADEGADGQLELAPPRHVGEVTERAAHGDAGALVGLRCRVGEDRDLDAEDRRRDSGADEVLVALVVGVHDQRHDARDQLGTGGLDVDRAAGPAIGGDRVERDTVVVTRVVARLELGLGDGGLEGDVPQGRRFREVGLAAGEVAQERPLADGARVVADGRVGGVPLHGEPELAPQGLEGLLVLDDQLLAQVDEVGSADRDLSLGVRLLRRREVVVVGQARVAADTEVVLHPALGRQAVVIPADRVEDGLALHALVARDQVRVAVGVDVSHVQRAAHGRRGRVDRVDVLPRLGAVEGVGVVVGPRARPLVLQPLQRRTLRYDDGTLVGARGRVRGLGGWSVSHARSLWTGLRPAKTSTSLCPLGSSVARWTWSSSTPPSPSSTWPASCSPRTRCWAA